MSNSKSNEKEEQLEELESMPASLIYESIRREGQHELSRSAKALWWSGIAAGIAISTSVMAVGFLTALLAKADWSKVVSSFGYCVGFLIVIQARMQLFTENTITPILQLFLAPSRTTFMRTGRLWLIVFLANMVGCAFAAALIIHGGLVPDKQLQGILEVSRHYADVSAFEHFRWGIFAGFIIAALVWTFPRLDGAGEVLTIIILTYIISIGGFSHVIAGSTELFIVMMNGELGFVEAVLDDILPTLAGNVLGGTGIFSALVYAQVREEV